MRKIHGISAAILSLTLALTLLLSSCGGGGGGGTAPPQIELDRSGIYAHTSSNTTQSTCSAISTGVDSNDVDAVKAVESGSNLSVTDNYGIPLSGTINQAGAFSVSGSGSAALTSNCDMSAAMSANGTISGTTANYTVTSNFTFSGSGCSQYGLSDCSATTQYSAAKQSAGSNFSGRWAVATKITNTECDELVPQGTYLDDLVTVSQNGTSITTVDEEGDQGTGTASGTSGTINVNTSSSQSGCNIAGTETYSLTADSDYLELNGTISATVSASGSCSWTGTCNVSGTIIGYRVPSS